MSYRGVRKKVISDYLLPFLSGGSAAKLFKTSFVQQSYLLTLLHSERPKLYTILAFPCAIGLKNDVVSFKQPNPGPEVKKTFFMLNSTEHEIFLLINVKMPTTVGILTFMSGKNSILGLSEPKKS